MRYWFSRQFGYRRVDQGDRRDDGEGRAPMDAGVLLAAERVCKRALNILSGDLALLKSKERGPGGDELRKKELDHGYAVYERAKYYLLTEHWVPPSPVRQTLLRGFNMEYHPCRVQMDNVLEAVGKLKDLRDDAFMRQSRDSAPTRLSAFHREP